MRPKTLILFFVAIGCGLVASIGVSQYMEKARATGGVQVETVKVYVAAAEINIGDKFDEKNVKLEEWPKDRVPEGAVSELKELEGKFPRGRLFKGEPILSAKLSSEISPNITKQIPPGYRMVTVKVNAESGLAGLLRPGDRVDLVVFMRKSAEVPETKTKTILTDVTVFACDAETERTVDKGSGQAREVRTVSLLVKPNQVETVTLAKELGTMSLTLRRPGEESNESSDGASVQSLLSSDGESANDKKKQHHDGEESGLSKWLNQGAQPQVQIPPQVPQIETPIEVPTPPAPVVIPEEPPKFVMKIRTPNGDREYRWKDLNGEPIEAGDEPVSQAPPAAAPAVTVPTVPAAQPGLRAMPIREFAPRGKASLRSGPVNPNPAPNQETESTDSGLNGLNEKQDN